MADTDAFRSSDEVFAWMSGFINLERSRSDAHYKLDRMRRLAELAGHPENIVPSIHVAGSKGKGSTTVMTAAILAAAGYKTARYVSPHVVDYRERVALADGPFPEPLYAAAGDELRAVVHRYLHTLDDSALPAQSPADPTFFELATLFYFLCCRRAGVEASVVETGLGGRLDATNILTPRLSVIMPIELEHTDILGPTLTAIAGEKAGIIKADRPVLLSAQPVEALDVFRQFAAERGSPLHYLPDEADITAVTVDRHGTAASVSFRNASFFPKPLNFRLKLIGEIQTANAALAALAVRLAFPEVDDVAISEGLAVADLPARFESIRDDPPLVIDGAHTEKSVQLCADLFFRLYGRGGLLLFGCAIDKDAAAMARILAPGFTRIVVTAPGTFKASDPEAAFRAFTDLGVPAVLESDTSAAIAAIDRTARTTKLPLLVVGSFYLASAIRSIIKNEAPRPSA